MPATEQRQAILDLVRLMAQRAIGIARDNEVDALLINGTLEPISDAKVEVSVNLPHRLVHIEVNKPEQPEFPGPAGHVVAMLMPMPRPDDGIETLDLTVPFEWIEDATT